MRTTTKGQQPESLRRWKVANPNSTYKDLSLLVNLPQGNVVRTDIRAACILEQSHLCAYCCDRISSSTSHNEHLASQASSNALTLDFNNIVASCGSNKHCGHHKAKEAIALTPLMPECEIEVKYNLNGKVRGSTPRAQSLNRIVNLHDASLTNKRKQLVDTLIYVKGATPDELVILDNELLQLIIEDLKVPDADQKLEAFSPVLISILTDFISNP